MKFESLFLTIISAVIAFTGCFVVIIGLGIGALVSDYSSKLKVPATIYEIGEVVNYDYKVVATDGKTLYGCNVVMMIVHMSQLFQVITPI